MKTIKLNGNPELTETSVLFAVVDILNQNSEPHISFDVDGENIVENDNEAETSIEWTVEKFNYSECGMIIESVSIDC